MSEMVGATSYVGPVKTSDIAALVTAEARYSFSNADVEGSYGGFNDIDLSGLQVMIGLGFQF